MDELRENDPVAVGEYRLLARLGAGGMGRVYLGRSGGGRTVAVKVVHPGLAEEPDFRVRFAREVAAARRVGGRWTAPVLDADTESSVPWVATGYVPGPALRQVVDSLHGPLPEPAVWALAFGLSEALRAIHAAGLIHRDLKPSNVMVTLEGPRVIDFGIAKAVDASVLTGTGAMVGSPGFMAPEQVRGEPLTTAADLFGLGAVLVHAATGTAPFSAGEVPAPVVIYRVLHEEPDLGALTGQLRELTVRCLAKDPAARPTVEEVGRLAAARMRVPPVDGTWLPGALAVRLGREAVRLLELEGPRPERGPSAVAFGGPAAAIPGGSPDAAPGHGPPPARRKPTPPGPPRRGRTAGLSVAVFATLLLFVVLLQPWEGDDPGGRESSRSPSADEGGNDPAGDADLPLHAMLPTAIREAGVITVGTTGPYPPMSFPEDEENGVDRELAAAMGDLLGVELIFRRLDFEVVGPALLSGDVDAVFGLADTEVTRGQGIDLVDYYRSGNALVVDASSGNTAGLEALCGGSVVTWPSPELVRSVEQAITDCGEGISVEGLADEVAMFDAVRNGDADGALINYPTAVHRTTGSGDGAEGLVIAGKQIDVVPFGIGVAVDQRRLRDAMQQAVQTLMDDGTYEEILTGHGLQDCALTEATVNAGG